MNIHAKFEAELARPLPARKNTNLSYLDPIADIIAKAIRNKIKMPALAEFIFNCSIDQDDIALKIVEIASDQNKLIKDLRNYSRRVSIATAKKKNNLTKTEKTDLNSLSESENQKPEKKKFGEIFSAATTTNEVLVSEEVSEIHQRIIKERDKKLGQKNSEA